MTGFEAPSIHSSKGKGAGSGSRIPLSLQAVFIASNRGQDVNKPPPEKVAQKTFFRSWMFQGIGKNKKKSSRNYVKSQKDRPPTVVQFGRFGKTQSKEPYPKRFTKDDATEIVEKKPSAPKPKVNYSKCAYVYLWLTLP